MTPRISPQPASSFERWRRDGDYAPVADRAIWNYLTQRGLRSDGGEPVDPLDVLQPDESGYLREHRVLSKGASGGGFLVPKELADRITSAARAAGVLAREAAEFVTESGAIFNAPVAGTHGTGAWIAESGSYTPSDETITNVALSAFNSTRPRCSAAPSKCPPTCPHPPPTPRVRRSAPGGSPTASAGCATSRCAALTNCTPTRARWGCARRPALTGAPSSPMLPGY